jgi:hypothetical protein
LGGLGDEMIIEQWNIVLSAAIGVLLVGYGVWLRYVLAQQLRSKDTAIQALEAALKAKDAEISRLQGDTAPAITAAYSTMRKYANEVTDDSRRLSQQVAELTQAQQRLGRIAPASKLLSECNGLFLATDILEHQFKDIYRRREAEICPETAQALINGVIEMFHKMNREIESRLPTIKAIIDAGKDILPPNADSVLHPELLAG